MSKNIQFIVEVVVDEDYFPTDRDIKTIRYGLEETFPDNNIVIYFNDEKDIISSRYFISGTYRSFDHMSEDYEYIDFSHIVNLAPNFTIEDVVKSTKELNSLLINLKPTHIKHISKL